MDLAARADTRFAEWLNRTVMFARRHWVVFHSCALGDCRLCEAANDQDDCLSYCGSWQWHGQSSPRRSKHWDATTCKELMISYQVVSLSPWVLRFQDDSECQIFNWLQLVAELN
jgi:hypothetical protein